MPLVKQAKKKKRKIAKEMEDFIVAPELEDFIVPPKKRKKMKSEIKDEGIKTEEQKGPKKTRNRKSKDDPKTSFYFPLDVDRDLDLKYQCRRCMRGFNELYDYRQH